MPRAQRIAIAEALPRQHRLLGIEGVFEQRHRNVPHLGFRDRVLRASFASHPFWVTRFRDEERYAAGDFPNQGAAGAGLQSFVTPAESLGGAAGADVVVWQTIGMTHVPRPEDYPVMPTESIGFKLVPHGFFDRNPALDAQELPQARPRGRAVRR